MDTGRARRVLAATEAGTAAAGVLSGGFSAESLRGAGCFAITDEVPGLLTAFEDCRGTLRSLSEFLFGAPQMPGCYIAQKRTHRISADLMSEDLPRVAGRLAAAQRVPL